MANPARRLRAYLRMETDVELRTRLYAHQRAQRMMISMCYGQALDTMAESMGLQRRIVEAES